MDNVVLGLMLLGSKTIYDIHASIKSGISLFYSASYGSIQAALAKLLQAEKIIVEEIESDGRRRKSYKVLDAGKTAFYTWLLEQPSGNKLEVQILSRVYFAGLLDDEVQQKTLGANIQRAIDGDLNELRALEKQLEKIVIPPQYERVFKFQLATLQYGIKSNELAKNYFKDIFS